MVIIVASLIFYFSSSIKLVPPILIKGAVVTEKGTVIENVINSSAGQPMFLKVKKEGGILSGSEFKVIYHANNIPCVKDAIYIKVGEKIEVHGLAIDDDTVSACESKDYYIKNLTTSAQDIVTNNGATANWKLFSNRSGWSIKYSADWRISSCQSCSDPTDPKVFVDFFPPVANNSDEGWLQISHVADKPTNKNVDEWLAGLKTTLNLNPILKEEKITINNLPALKVRYRNPYAGSQESEAVYLVSGSQTFTIAFSGNKAGVILEKFGNYNVYLQMLSTFNVNH